MQFINPSFINEFKTEFFDEWFENKINGIVLNDLYSRVGNGHCYTDTERQFCEKILSMARVIVSLDYNGRRNFLNHDLTIEKELLILDFPKQLEILKQNRERQRSERNRNEFLGEINKLLMSFCLGSITGNQSIRAMYQEANNVFQKAFSRKAVWRVLEKIFDYQDFSDRFRVLFIERSQVSVCPYCNRSFITRYIKDGHPRYTGDLDHYYCKSLYPFFAVNLWNLIPVCGVCNERLKLNHDNYKCEILYPYKRWEDEILSFYPQLTQDGFSFENPDDFVVQLTTDGVRSSNSNDLFCLKDIYQSHKEIVTRIAFLDRIITRRLCNEIAILVGEPKITANDVMKEMLKLKYCDGKSGILSKFSHDISAFL